jgi:hypothetical protein
MSLECDAQGWQYNIVFRDAGWHAYPRFRHSFVRRRHWVRERRIAHPTSTAAALAPDQPDDLKLPLSPAAAEPHNSAFADPRTPSPAPVATVSAGPPPVLNSLLPGLDPHKAVDLLG